MAGERQAPGLGLYTGWDIGSDGWGQQHDDGIVAVSVLTQGRALSRTTNLPASPTQGQIYIVPVGQPNENDIAAYDDGAWVYFTPQEGYEMYVADSNEKVRFGGTAWSVPPVTVPTNERNWSVKTANYATVAADFDGNTFVAMNVATANTLTIASGMGATRPMTVVQMGDGVTTIGAGAGVTLLSKGSALSLAGRYASAVIVPTSAANTFVVIGDITV